MNLLKKIGNTIALAVVIPLTIILMIGPLIGLGSMLLCGSIFAAIWSIGEKIGKEWQERTIRNMRRSSERRDGEITPFKSGKKYGFRDTQTKEIVISALLDYADDFHEGIARVMVNQKEIYSSKQKWGFVSQDNALFLSPVLDYAENFVCGFAKVRVQNQEYVLDKNFKMYQPYGMIGKFCEELALVALNGKYGYINKSGNLLIPAIYDKAHDFEDGLARVQINGKWGLIDHLNNFTLAPEFEFKSIYDDEPFFKNGLAAVKKGDKWGAINKNGDFIIKPIYSQLENFEEGVAGVLVNRIPGFDNGKWGFIDQTGNIVIEPAFEDIGDFQSGLAAVRLNGRWGFIDHAGEIVIKPVFEEVSGFYKTSSNTESDNCELASAKLDGKWGAIDKNGEFIVPNLYGWFRFEGNVAVVEKGGKCGAIDTEGSIIVPILYDEWFNFEGDIAIVEKNGKRFFINKKGQNILNEGIDGHIAFREGIAVFKNNHVCGFIDTEGKCTFVELGGLPKCYEQYADQTCYKSWRIEVSGIEEFRNGLAPVSVALEIELQKETIQDRYNEAIEKHGDEFIYLDDYDGFEEMNKMDYDYGWGFIDTSGQFVIPPIYDEVEPFNDSGVAKVKLKQKPEEWLSGEPEEWIFINRSNEQVQKQKKKLSEDNTRKKLFPLTESLFKLEPVYRAFILVNTQNEILNPHIPVPGQQA